MNLCMNTIGEYLYYGIFYKSNGGGCSGPIENIEIYSYTFLCTAIHDADDTADPFTNI